MKLLTHLTLVINTDGCAELPFAQEATQTLFNYVHGASGYVVFALGCAALVIGIASKSKLATIPGWMAGVVIAALALTALPSLLPALGIDLGCGVNTTEIDSEMTDLNSIDETDSVVAVEGEEG